jgi:hypothetical protein
MTEKDFAEFEDVTDSTNKTKDIFSFVPNDFECTNGQVNALKGISNEMNEFIYSGSYPYTERLLKGYAGTGKTTVVKFIVAYLEQHANDFSGIAILAPTNKAKLVIEKKLGQCADTVKVATIHSFVYGKPEKDEEGNDIWTTGTATISDKIIIIDECSMVSLQMYNDFLEVTTNCYCLYVGDFYQLEQIGKPSPINTFKGWELTEVRRTDNSITELATVIRTIDKNVIYSEDTNEVLIMSKDDATSYFTNCFNKDSEFYNTDTIFIVATNNVRIILTAIVRNDLFDDKPPLLAEGEPIMVISNSKLYSNGEIIITKTVEFLQDFEILVANRYAKNGTGYDSFKGALMKVNGNYIVFIPETIEPSISIYKFNEASPKTSVDMENWKFYLREMETRGDVYDYLYDKNSNERYYNSFNSKINICTFGYVSSAHKLQGSEFTNVFINQNYSAPTWASSKWFYTALTRAVKRAVIVPNTHLQSKRKRTVLLDEVKAIEEKNNKLDLEF